MDVTDVRVKLIYQSSDRLKAVCAVTFDGEFVVRDVKVVEGEDGFFVAMPSRKLSARCGKCRHKNQLRARFCEECGERLPAKQPVADSNGRPRLYRDVAHPITPEFRRKLQEWVIEAYHTACDEEVVDGEEPVERKDAEAVEAVEAAETAPSSDFGGAGEYGAMIADLQGARSKDETGERDRPRRPRDRGRRDERREPKPAIAENVEDAQPDDKPVVEDATFSSSADSTSDSHDDTHDESDDVAFAAGIISEETESRSTPDDSETTDRPTSDDVVTAETLDGNDEEEDDTPFGAGLL